MLQQNDESNALHEQTVDMMKREIEDLSKKKDDAFQKENYDLAYEYNQKIDILQKEIDKRGSLATQNSEQQTTESTVTFSPTEGNSITNVKTKEPTIEVKDQQVTEQKQQQDEAQPEAKETAQETKEESLEKNISETPQPTPTQPELTQPAQPQPVQPTQSTPSAQPATAWKRVNLTEYQRSQL